MTLNKRNTMKALLAASMLTPVAFAPAIAQDDDEASFFMLEEIIVTAQKREQGLQDVPFSVTAIGADAIEKLSIHDITDVSALAPNFTVGKTPSATSAVVLFMRGIGDNEPVLTVDSPVGLYADGVIIGRSTGAIFDLVEMERIEVLRGPQGTLYGRNTSGGAVNLITKKPADEFGVKVKVGYGSHEAKNVLISVDTGEIGDTGIKLKISGLHRQVNGYINNPLEPLKSNHPGAEDVEAVRVALRWDMTDSFAVDYAFDYSDKVGRSPAFQLAGVTPGLGAWLGASEALGGGPMVVSTEKQKTLALDLGGDMTDKSEGHALTLTYEGDNISFKSITAYRTWDNINGGGDLDGHGDAVGQYATIGFNPATFRVELGLTTMPFDLFSAVNERHQDQWSQEFQVLGNVGDNFEYVVGAYYFKEDATEDNPQSLDLVLPNTFMMGFLGSIGVTAIFQGQIDAYNAMIGGVDPGGFGLIDAPTFVGGLGGTLSGYTGFDLGVANHLFYSHTSKSKAAFGQGTYRVGDDFNVTVGIRYTEDTKHLTQSNPNNPFDTIFNRDDQRTDDSFDFAVALDYTWSEQVNTYLRVASGYRAGGYNPRSIAGYAPEKLLTYEAGLKTEFMDRRVRWNASVFHSTYSDRQITNFVASIEGAVADTTNSAEDVKYKGFETEIQAVLAEGLFMQGTYGYTDRPSPEGDGREIYSSATTWMVGMQYAFPAITSVDVTANINYAYRSRTYWSGNSPFNDQTTQPGYGLMNARLTVSNIALGDSGTTATIALWGKNLTDKDYRYSGIDFGSLGFAGNIFADGRTGGIEATLQF